MWGWIVLDQLDKTIHIALLVFLAPNVKPSSWRDELMLCSPALSELRWHKKAIAHFQS
jgi:hypothetical protein